MAAFTDHFECLPLITPAAVLECCKVANDAGLTATSQQVLDAVEDASTLLYYLLGRQFNGTCESTLRPCIPCGCNGGGCCCERDAIDLGLWPITRIVSVWSDGAYQPVTDYHIDNWHELVRSSRDKEWPSCGNLWAARGSADDNENDGYVWEIVVEHGLTPPRLVQRAARDMACELLKHSCLGECALPERVTSISRRGLSMEVGQQPDDFFQNGYVGVYSVDLAIKTYNPTKLQSPSFVWSPDLKRNNVHRTYT